MALTVEDKKTPTSLDQEPQEGVVKKEDMGQTHVGIPGPHQTIPTIPNPAVVSLEQFRRLEVLVDALREEVDELRILATKTRKDAQAADSKTVAGTVVALAGLSLGTNKMVMFRQMCPYLPWE